MKYIKQSATKFLAAAALMIVMVIAASWQFYHFIIFRNAGGLLDAQGGKYHLWLALGAILTAAIAACLMFLFYLGSGSSKQYEVLPSTLEPAPVLINLNPNTNSQAPDNFNAIRWAQQNEWCVAGQADDRRPMNSSVGASLGSASAQRAAARLTHQGMYSKWARERHD